MKMIVAINNKIAEEKITNKYYSKYEIYIVKSSDMIFKLTLNEKKAIVILRDDIKGSISFKDLIFKLKEKNNDIQIVVLVKELTKELKEMLFAKEIFNIIEGKKFSFSELEDLIENPKMIVYKEKLNDNIASNVILITGGRGVGKTLVSILFSRTLAKDRKKKVLLLDFDLLYPTLDVYLDINRNYSLVDYIDDLMNDKIKSMENYESLDLKYNNLRYILNSKSIGIPSNENIIKIIESLKNIYDYVVIDTSSLMLNKIYTIANLKNYQIIDVIEPGKKAIKDYMLENMYLSDELRTNLIVICNKINILYNLKRCSREYKTKILGFVRYSSFFRVYHVFKGWYFVSNFKKVLRRIGIDRFKKLKNNIVRKIFRN